jgi:RND family efflux transporter MFP subunit
MKRWICVLGVVGACLALMGCGKSEGNASGNEERVPVEALVLQPGNIVQSISFTGDVRAEYEVKVFSRIPNRIEKMHVDDGDRVRKGDPIADIEATALEQAVLQAEAALTAARAQEANVRVEYERAKRLFRENALSQQQHDAVQTQFEAVKAQTQQAEAMVTAARSQRSDAKIVAPIAGIIALRAYDEGDMASPAVPVVSIVQMDRVSVEVQATELDLEKLRQGQEAHVRVRSYPDRQFGGAVQKISPVLDPASRMVKVEVLVGNAEHLLKPGMFAQVDIFTGELKQVLVIPRYATMESTRLETTNGQERAVKDYFVFVINGDRAERRRLVPAYENHEFLAVKEGVSAGERLVTVGHQTLRENALVNVVRLEGKGP